MQLSGAMNIADKFDLLGFQVDTDVVLQSSVKKQASGVKNLAELKRGQSGILDHIDLDEHEARRLMELGFLPGQTVTAAHSAPGGDPTVFRVDGSEVALRRDTARKLLLKR
jgi:ferrous iron transport protein A